MLDDDTYPRTGIVIPDKREMRAEDAIKIAERADANSVDSIWCWEGWGYDPFVLLGQISEQTDCVLGTGIANVFSRSPAALAMAGSTLHSATDGKFILGLGTSTRGLVEDLHGQEFEHPVRRLREVIEIVNTVLSGQKSSYDGKIFDLDGPKLNHTGDVEVPIFNAALGQLNVSMTVEYADGYMPNLVPFEAIDDVISEAEERTGTEADVRIAPQVPTLVSDDPEGARNDVARDVASYVGGVEPYNRSVKRAGFENIAREIEEAWSDEEYSRATALTERELLDSVAAVGEPNAVEEQLRSLSEGPADTILSTIPGSADDEELEMTVEAIGHVD